MTGFDELVTAATVGIAQRPLAVTELAGPAAAHTAVLDDDPAVQLLDAAALVDAARRAGALPTPPPASLPEPAPADTTPELSAVGSDLLRDVLARGDRELVADLLASAAGAGVRVAPPDLPALLATGASHRPLRAPVAAVLGERGRWLAARHPEWRVVIDAAAPAAHRDAWATGRLPERVGWLLDLRGRDPARAREALAAGWRHETGDDRAALLAALATGLSAADEQFLEAALDDRKAEVRDQARTLLARLPGSAFVARAADRARPVLRASRGVRGLRIAVTAPDAPDAAGRRDGLTARPPGAVSSATWQLFQVIGRAPLAGWTERLGADPATLVRQPIGDGFRDEVLAGWRAAALRERNTEWAAALLAEPVNSPLAPPDERLAALLPIPVRVARAVAVLSGERAGTIADVAVCPAPWPAELTDAALGYFGAQLRSTGPAPPGDLPQLVARRVDLADRREIPAWLRELADRYRARTAAVPAAGRWAAPLERAAATLDLRRRFARELP